MHIFLPVLQRYISNDEFYQEGGPLFIFVGGEWEISTGYVTGGHFYDLAKEHNGYLFYTEHRYYGKSWPTRWVVVVRGGESTIWILNL